MLKSKISVVCCTIIVSSVFLVFVSTEPAGAADPQYKFRMGCIMAENVPTGKGGNRMIEEIEKRSKGRIKVDAFYKGQLGGELDMLGQVRMGMLDLGIISPALVASVEPTFSILDLPFIWKSDVAVRKVLDGPIGHKMLNLLEVKGIKGFAWGELGFRVIMTTKKPILSPEDLKGLKIRVVENPLYIQTLRAYGANAVPMAWPEVYTALDQGTIDGVDTNLMGLMQANMYDVAKCLAVTNHIYTGMVILMNLKTYQKLPKELQQVMLEAAKIGGDYNRELVRKEDEDAIGFMEKKGVKVTRPEQEPFKAIAAKVYKQFSVQVGQDLIDQVIAAQK